MNLSTHFTLDELTHTTTGIENVPTQTEINKLTILCVTILERIRGKWGPIDISSGFRCPEVNKSVGGVSKSQHVYGEAADIIPAYPDLDAVYDWIVCKSGLRYGQCIKEDKSGMRWIHISIETDKLSMQALVYENGRYKPYEGNQEGKAV